MRTQFTSELRKVTTTKLWWILLLLMVLFSAGTTALFLYFALNAPHSPVEFGSPGTVVPFFNLAAAVAYIFPLAMGTVLTTQEYSSRTITTTLLTEPVRGRVYGGKLLAGACVALAYGVISVAACTAAAATMLSAHGERVYLTDSGVVLAILGSVAVISVWGIVGVGVGALVRNQAAALVGILLVTQCVEPLVRMISSSMGSPAVGNFLPGGAGDTASGGTITQAAIGSAVESQALGFGVLGLYVAAVTVLGWWRFARYEVD